MATERLTATWQFSCLPICPLYRRATPTECLSFLGKPVSSTTSHDGVSLLDCRKNRISHLDQQFLVLPGSVGDQMMQRLVRPLGMDGIQTRGHRLHAFPVTRQKQALAVGLERLDSINVPGGISQTLEVSASRFCCGSGAEEWAPTKQFYINLFVYNTVVLGDHLDTQNLRARTAPKDRLDPH